MFKIENIHHIAILTTPALYQDCKKFYTQILGFSVVLETYRESRNSYKLDLALNGLYQIELFSFPDYLERSSFPESKGLRHLAFGVNEIESAREWLFENKVRIEEIRTDLLTGKQFLFFYDPNGQPLELYQL